MKVLYGKAANLLPARLTNIEGTWDKLKAWPSLNPSKGVIGLGALKLNLMSADPYKQL